MQIFICSEGFSIFKLYTPRLADSNIRSPLLSNISGTILRVVSFIPFSVNFHGLCTCVDKESEPQQYRVKMAPSLLLQFELPVP